MPRDARKYVFDIVEASKLVSSRLAGDPDGQPRGLGNVLFRRNLVPVLSHKRPDHGSDRIVLAVR